MVKANSGTQMVMFLTVNGKMIKHTDMAFIATLTEQGTRAIGNKICSMDRVKKLGKTEVAMKALTTKE